MLSAFAFHERARPENLRTGQSGTKNKVLPKAGLQGFAPHDAKWPAQGCGAPSSNPKGHSRGALPATASGQTKGATPTIRSGHLKGAAHAIGHAHPRAAALCNFQTGSLGKRLHVAPDGRPMRLEREVEHLILACSRIAQLAPGFRCSLLQWQPRYARTLWPSG